MCETYRNSSPVAITKNGCRIGVRIHTASDSEWQRISVVTKLKITMAFWGSKSKTSETSGGGVFGKLRQGLRKTSQVLNTDIRDLFKAEGRFVDDEFLGDLFARLVRTDMGAGPAGRIRDEIAKQFRGRRVELDEVLSVIRGQIQEMLAQHAEAMKRPDEGPLVILVVGVNGSGKTTSIAKLANLFTKQGSRVVLGAGDTFRAAAVEQLGIWAERIGCQIVKGKPEADPASVAYTTVQTALDEKLDVAIIDTLADCRRRNTSCSSWKRYGE